MVRSLAKKIIHWLLLVVIVAYVITGFGITEYRTVESLTFGLLTKSLSFKIHDSLFIPSLVLLILHVCFSFIVKLKRTKNST